MHTIFCLLAALYIMMLLSLQQRYFHSCNLAELISLSLSVARLRRKNTLKTVQKQREVFCLRLTSSVPVSSARHSCWTVGCSVPTYNAQRSADSYFLMHVYCKFSSASLRRTSILQHKSFNYSVQVYNIVRTVQHLYNTKVTPYYWPYDYTLQ